MEKLIMSLNLKLISLVLILFVISGCENTVSDEAFVFVPKGLVDIGSEDGLASEKPVKRYSVNSFYLATHPVTVVEFREFINATNYVTEAEEFGDSGVFSFENKQCSERTVLNAQPVISSTSGGDSTRATVRGRRRRTSEYANRDVRNGGS